MDSQEEILMLMKQLEEISPKQLLKEISGGAEATKADLRIVEDVMINQKLPPGVVNVLIYYVMLRNDMKLPKSYVEKLAGHWARKKISTVAEAMALVKEENRQYQEWAEKKKEIAKPTPVERVRSIAIEQAISQGISDVELGKFVRTLFEENQ
ncbi:helicase DnaB [Bacillus thuringiensis]|nr:helicase DnaB [Bacillus sp. M13(2017)]QCY61392.1 helicase DnaB [Bacillus thuringiensis]